MLCFADAEHPGPAFYADTLGARFAIPHSDGIDIFHFPGSLAFHAITIHRLASCIITYIIAACLQLINKTPPCAPVSLYIGRELGVMQMTH
jgi:hypothetical protein